MNKVYIDVHDRIARKVNYSVEDTVRYAVDDSVSDTVSAVMWRTGSDSIWDLVVGGLDTSINVAAVRELVRLGKHK